MKGVKMDTLEMLEYMSADVLLEELERYFPTSTWNEALEYIAEVWDLQGSEE